MGNIQEKIGAFLPEAIFEEGQYLTVSGPADKVNALCRFLHDDKDLQFDNLVSLIGMDWGETLGVVYYLNSTKYNHWVILKVETSDKENPLLYTVSDIWKNAELNEREVYDFFGIRFINHPDMRHLFLREDWVGYPFRKDYDANPEINPIPTENESCSVDTVSLREDAEGRIIEEKRKVFQDNDYIVNIGPQHPATHGVLRFQTALDGETIKKIDVHCGYIHRGIEKMWESMTYPQTLHLTDRLDYLSSHNTRQY